jgi:hypothetical protein
MSISIIVYFNTEDDNGKIYIRTMDIKVNPNNNVSELMKGIRKFISSFEFERSHGLYNMTDETKLDKSQKISFYNTTRVYISTPNPDRFYRSDINGNHYEGTRLIPSQE